MQQDATILMGDVIGSSTTDPTLVQSSLRAMVDEIDERFTAASPRLRESEAPPEILSPLTITLGDEFQGVVSDLHAAVLILFAFEEYRLEHGVPFELHFVTYQGEIDTPLNEERAHGMLGPGLTAARALLTEKGRSRPRFRFAPAADGALATPNALFLDASAPLPERWLSYQLNLLNDTFAILESLVSHWKLKDFALISSMIAHPDDDAAVGELHGKNRSQIWKRRRTLRVDDYLHLKNLATNIAAPAAPDS